MTNPLPDGARPTSTDTGTAGRDALIGELVDLMTSWNAEDRIKAFRQWLKGSISLIHLHVLTVLEADGPLPMSRLADTLDVSVASTTGIVGRMEERNLVERHHDSDDRRVVLVVPTATGLEVFRSLIENRRDHLTSVLTQLSDEELQSFLVGLRAVRAARATIHAAAAVETPDAGQ
ncbi:MAG TPA: MarR family winged helix-turn-helix transcriptional regulator [Methylomirabilota bacterium]|nr:MarR family winged helix-turn-helix transcriptional regulator [Methylomirabilota bacterium]